MGRAALLKSGLMVCFLTLLFLGNLRAEDSPSSNYRDRFEKAPTPKREDPVANGEEDGGDGGGGSKGGKSRKKKKKKKKKDDFRRVVGGPHDPIVPVTGVKTGDLASVTYKSPTPATPLLEKAWNSTAWAPTYQPASRSLLGEKGNLEAVIQSDLIKHTGWKVDGDSISVSPDLNGGPYDAQTGQAITFTVDREGGNSVGLLGMLGQAASMITRDNPLSVLGPLNRLKNPFSIFARVESTRLLTNDVGVLVGQGFYYLGLTGPNQIAARFDEGWSPEVYLVSTPFDPDEGGAVVKDALGGVGLFLLFSAVGGHLGKGAQSAVPTFNPRGITYFGAGPFSVGRNIKDDITNTVNAYRNALTPYFGDQAEDVVKFVFSAVNRDRPLSSPDLKFESVQDVLLALVGRVSKEGVDDIVKGGRALSTGIYAFTRSHLVEARRAFMRKLNEHVPVHDMRILTQALLGKRDAGVRPGDLPTAIGVLKDVIDYKGESPLGLAAEAVLDGKAKLLWQRSFTGLPFDREHTKKLRYLIKKALYLGRREAYDVKPMSREDRSALEAIGKFLLGD